MKTSRNLEVLLNNPQSKLIVQINMPVLKKPNDKLKKHMKTNKKARIIAIGTIFC